MLIDLYLLSNLAFSNPHNMSSLIPNPSASQYEFAARLTGHTAAINTVAISVGGDLLASGGEWVSRVPVAN